MEKFQVLFKAGCSDSVASATVEADDLSVGIDGFTDFHGEDGALVASFATDAILAILAAGEAQVEAEGDTDD